MAHRYQDPVEVWTDTQGMPTAFTWRGITYGPFEVIGQWHLRDRWWEGRAIRERSDRHYYRLLMPDQQVFELYQDATGGWVLDVVQD